MKTVHQTEAGPVRFHELDSLRGVAACTVVLHHFWLAMGDAVFLAMWHSPLRFLVDGHDAVILFFVLSGFVLALPFEHNPKLAYWKFIVKRICRIYLPYLGALFIAVAMNFKYHGIVTNYGWIDQTWNQKPHGHAIIQGVLFLGDYQWARFNTAFWSLVYEMRISLIFPFLAIAIMRLRNRWMLGFAILTSLFTVHSHRVFALVHLDPPSPQFADTLHYMSFFILGAILAKSRESIEVRYRQLPRFLLFPVIAFAIMLYFHPFNVPAFTNWLLPPEKIEDWSAAFGSLIALTLALCSCSFKKFLNHGCVHYLGRISYSLYLVHGTVVFSLIYIFQGYLKLIEIPIYLLAVLCLASIFYQLVEKPSMALGQKLGRMMS